MKDWKEYVELGLNVQQSIRSEQILNGLEVNTRELDAVHQQIRALGESLAAEQESRQRQARIREILFVCRQTVDQAAAEKDPFVSYRMLKSVEPHIRGFHTAAIEELTDKEYHADTARRMDKALAAIKEALGPTPWKSLESLFQLLNSCLKLCRLLMAEELDRRGKLSADRPDIMELLALLRSVDRKAVGSRSFHCDVMRLSQMVNQAGTLASYVPNLPPALFNRATLLDACQEGVIRPHRRHLFGFKCMVLVAKADGPIDDRKRSFLREAATGIMGIGLSETEAEELIVSTANVQRSEFDGDVEAAREIVNDLYACACGDGEVTPQERATVARFGQALGVPPEYIQELFRAPLDARRARAVCDKARPEEVEGIHWGKAVTAEDLESVRMNFPLFFNEQVVLVNFPKGHGAPSNVLTDRNLYVVNSADNNFARISFADFVNVSHGVLSAKILLANGHQIKTNSLTFGFLQFAKRLIDECTKAPPAPAPVELGGKAEEGVKTEVKQSPLMDPGVQLQYNLRSLESGIGKPRSSCDVAAALALFSKSAMRDVLLVGAISEGDWALLREQLAMMPEENVVAVFSRKTMILSGGRRTLASAVLTDKMLYVTSIPSFGQIRAGQIPVERISHSEIEQVGAGITFVGVILKGGRRIKTDRAMGDFLKLADQVIRTCSRSA